MFVKMKMPHKNLEKSMRLIKLYYKENKLMHHINKKTKKQNNKNMNKKLKILRSKKKFIMIYLSKLLRLI
jgi:hypothetical protein